MYTGQSWSTKWTLIGILWLLFSALNKDIVHHWGWDSLWHVLLSAIALGCIHYCEGQRENLSRASQKDVVWAWDLTNNYVGFSLCLSLYSLLLLSLPKSALACIVRSYRHSAAAKYFLFFSFIFTFFHTTPCCLLFCNPYFGLIV